SPAVIRWQPVDRDIFAGQTVALTVVAFGPQPLSYQWLKDGQPVSEATNATLTILNAPLTASGGYAVEVSNAAGSVTSRVATVTVRPRPSCVSSPAGLVSWWTFDVDADDVMGTNPGLASGAPGLG